LRAKVSSIVLLWITIGSTILFAVDYLPARVLLGIIALGVTVHLLRMRTLTREMLDADGNQPRF
jgi:hypothetical protein